jgi:hypothetical protein
MVNPQPEEQFDRLPGSHDFSLMAGGPLYRLARRIGLPEGNNGVVLLGLCSVLVTWLPLVVLNAVSGTVTGGSAVPFLSSIGTHVRFLVAVPLFFIGESAFDARVRQVLAIIAASQLISTRELPAFSAALLSAKRWRDSWWLEPVLLLLTALFIYQGVRTDLPEKCPPGARP